MVVEEELSLREDGDENRAGARVGVVQFRHELVLWVVRSGRTRCEFLNRSAGADILLALQLDVDIFDGRHSEFSAFGS